MKSSADNSQPDPSVNHPQRVAAEIVLIVTVFFVYAGSPPPDVNEAHYLAKAKHDWNPAWCAGDQFLESADAHLVFYWTFGWLTLWLPLLVAAWVGRILTWGLLAWAWRRLSVAVAPQRWMSVLSAAAFLCLLDRANLAGEWVVGGIEAKGFAYVLVLLALEALVNNRWKRVWLLIGAAGAFHVLVGGWSAIAAAAAWAVSGRERPSLRETIPFAAGGLLLALPGLLPALMLTRGVDPEVVREANLIYVYERLPHHLVFHQFSHVQMGVFAGLLAVWIGLWMLVRRDVRQQRLQRFVAGAVAIGILGAVIDQSTLYYRDLAASLLRYYWFRMSDSMAPLGVALAGATALVAARQTRSSLAAPAMGITVLLVIIGMSLEHLQRRALMLPGAELQSLSRPIEAEEAQRRYEQWRAVCLWIDDQTEPDALFLTPRQQQTFKWFAQRAEVCNRKDVPQDAASLIEWRRRQELIYAADVQLNGLTAHSDEALLRLAEEFGADYLLIDRSQSVRRPEFERVFPPQSGQRTWFEVYRLPVNGDRVSQ